MVYLSLTTPTVLRNQTTKRQHSDIRYVARRGLSVADNFYLLEEWKRRDVSYVNEYLTRNVQKTWFFFRWQFLPAEVIEATRRQLFICTLHMWRATNVICLSLTIPTYTNHNSWIRLRVLRALYCTCFIQMLWFNVHIIFMIFTILKHKLVYLSLAIPTYTNRNTCTTLRNFRS